MDESHSDWDPTTPSICLIWHPEFWWVVSVHALDKNDMIATSRTTFWASVRYLFLICSEMLHSLMILLRNVPYVVDMLRNILYAIDKLQYVSFVTDMLQLLYAPSVRNQICKIERIIVFLLLMILCLRNRIFCLVFWNYIALEIVLFWYRYVSHLLSSLCSPRLLINFSG